MIDVTPTQHFSFTSCLSFLDRGYNECLYSVEGGVVTRLIRISKGVVLIQVRSDDDHQVSVAPLTRVCNEDELREIEDYVSDWFDLHRDISDFYRLLEKLPQTREFTRSFSGLRLMGIVDLFEALCWCVIGQQINLTFAHKLKTRLVHESGESVHFEGRDYYCFPKPESILSMDESLLRGMQFSRQKISYLYNIAEAFISGKISKAQLLMENEKEQLRILTEVKGIGPWTANYASMKSLRNMNCITYGDTGLSAALHKNFNTEKKPDVDTINGIFENFIGWKSYFNHYLWKSLS